ncbi:MAG: Glu/Leu/Phe/Val dehydrogenase [Rhodospirillales bacterium]|nr:Glu/Leu/Phe/Val dehydrogenase [Rhodospirillales bacterium]
MKDCFEFADDLGPAKIVHIYEPALDLRAVVAIDNVACGPSIGGVRMAPDVSAEEAFRLARAMTLKNAAAGLAHGGGMSVIFGDPRMPIGRKESLIRAFAVAIGPLTDYIPGPDMGTDETCMAWIRDEIGRSVGLPSDIGGIPLDEIGATGFGLAVCAEVAQEFASIELDGARVAIQGFGSVGQHAAKFLSERGARIVAAADSGGATWNSSGLDLDALISLKRDRKSVAESSDGETGSPESIIDIDCDIWIPAARPDVIRRDNVDRLKTRLILQGANIPITHEAETILHERGVLCVPDFIANAGGVICAAVEFHGGTQNTALATIEEKIRTNTRTILEDAANTGTTPRHAATALANRRVRRAMVLTRWSHESALSAAP